MLYLQRPCYTIIFIYLQRPCYTIIFIYLQKPLLHYNIYISAKALLHCNINIVSSPGVSALSTGCCRGSAAVRPRVNPSGRAAARRWRPTPCTPTVTAVLPPVTPGACPSSLGEGPAHGAPRGRRVSTVR